MLALALVLSLALVTTAVAAPTPAPNTSTAERSTAAARFHQDIQPILSRYCYDCHADGMNKGKVAFDEFKDNQDLMGRTELWLAVLKNVRAGIMPPAKKPRPTPEELQRLERWIKHDSFAIDPDNPDPGRVTIRRLNRIEYRNTVRDLTGYDFNVDEELPPDDTGYGFDTIGDVLTVSPMLLEKYMQAAEAIAAGAVPRQARVIRQKTLAFSQFRFTNPEATNEPAGDRLSFYKPAQLEHHFDADLPGTYRVRFNFEIAGMFDFDPGRCRVIVRVDDQEALQEEFAWQNHKKVPLEFERRWDPGQRRLALELVPLTPIEQKKNSLDLRLASVRIDGPIEQQHWVRPKHFESFFWQDPPARPADRRRYTREVLQRFATRAYRRPVDERTLDRLVTIALETAETAGKTFEDGIAQALVPVLASPRFLMRIEGDLPGARFPLIDEYALASRLSYFLWSTMPDPALFQLAEQGALRRNLAPQVERMLADPRSNELIAHFVGQWLQVRDLDGIDINARAVLARDSGAEREMQLARARLQELQAKAELTPEEKQERDKLFEQRRQRFRMPVPELDRELRRAMRQETEMLFAHVLRNNRSLVELIDSDYTFLNARLAKHYGITNVSGAEMRQVALPAGHARGGLLTQGSTLIVTSNPTRTSPVKRGLFLLDNILGTPPPPPPADIRLLEESEKEFKDRDPTLREILAVHREKPLCASCHNRMDPLGLALENFNALGMWREKERGQPIDANATLISGESFTSIQELKRILGSQHRLDFYRCLTEKLLTYALGRGIEFSDVETVDRIVARLDRENGRAAVLLEEIIQSAPFQRRRPMPEAPAAQASRASIR